MAVRFFEQFVLGLQALHVGGVCHRDIKCENIFLDQYCNLKIADFGFAAPIMGKNYASPIKGALKTRLGTMGQIAPEILALKDKEGYSGHLVDIFNSGIILFNMIF